MHFICSKNILLKFVNISQKAVCTKTTNEILKNILLVAKDNKLNIIGYNLDISIECSISDVDIYEEGSILIDSKLFGSIIKKLPDTFIELKCDLDSKLIISYGDSKFEIQGEDSNNFPKIPILSDSKKYYIPQKKLKNMIKQTIFAVSTDTSKPILTGELFEIDNNKINLVSIDGYRLAISNILNNDNIEKDIKIIIPGKSLSDLNSFLVNNDDLIEIQIFDKFVLFKYKEIKFITRTIEGDFIEYKKLLPREYNTKIKLKTNDLISSLERASLLSQMQKSNLIKLEIRENLLTITSNNDKGNINEKINVEFEGEFLDIAFNSRYLIEGVKNIENDEIILEFTTNVNPCVIKPVDNTDYTYLLLPVRISSNI